MSVPGAFGPTWLGDRLCMDGGMQVTSTHCDLVAGDERVLIISLSDGVTTTQRLSALPNTIHQEVAYLEAGGSDVMIVAASPDPSVDLLAPDEVAGAMRVAEARAREDLEKVREFWG